MPPVKLAAGSASTDAEGRFQISGLRLGEYVIAAAPSPLFPSGGRAPARLYGATFFPSTLDVQQAVSVSAFSYPATTVQLELVPVRGVRVSGSVMSRSGCPADGLTVRLYRRFGGFGPGSDVAVVDAKGTFEIPRVPPGWYRLTIGPRTSPSGDGGDEFADEVIEVQDRDLDDLSLVLDRGASLSGRIIVEAPTKLPARSGYA
jgi:hypothetical protein